MVDLLLAIAIAVFIIATRYLLFNEYEDEDDDE